MHMNQHRKNVLSLLFMQCQGSENAVKSGEITGMTGLPDREIRDIIRDLRLEGHPIGSSPARGFWWISDPAELKEFIECMKGRGFSILKTVKKLANVTALELAGQLQVELEG